MCHPQQAEQQEAHQERDELIAHAQQSCQEFAAGGHVSDGVRGQFEHEQCRCNGEDAVDEGIHPTRFDEWARHGITLTYVRATRKPGATSRGLPRPARGDLICCRRSMD
ncbi:hypothetical protein SDC9_152635 [bioreactor metagenome]|uniref:Uncharacterized protein n=1 Tax=bioreactor metagenome TaxID=1076179 RepID=A0A645ETM6_9ZZZZ